MRVYSAPDLRVKDPRTRQFIGREGVEVDETDLVFHRLLLDGDLVTDPPAEPAEAPDAPPATAPAPPTEPKTPAPAAAAAAAPAKALKQADTGAAQ